MAYLWAAGNEAGEPVGYIAEEPRGFFGVIARQAFATHRPFWAVIMDLEGSPVMWARINIKILGSHSMNLQKINGRFVDHSRGLIRGCMCSA